MRENGVLIGEYGEYPQQAVSKQLQKELEKLYKRKKLNQTGRHFTTDSRKYNEYDKGFEKLEHIEYEYKGKKYVRVKANTFYDGAKVTLSNGEECQDGDYIWIEVQPIKWIIDEKKNIAFTKKLLFSGIQYDKKEDYKETFDDTNIDHFLNECFIKEISSSLMITEDLSVTEEEQEQINEGNKKRTRIQKMNPDTTEQKERVKMTDSEIIKSWIDRGQSVLLRGPSGIGKTERIKTLYPDLIYIKLTNNMFPEKVVGSMNLQTGQNIPPDFAKQAILSCATEEEKKLVSENIQNLYDLADIIYERSKQSDEKIVILLDELLNVKPAVQSLVYTLVLNRLVETGKGLKLPENTVIVATGNQKKYSSVAEDLAEPLEKRFDHILDMQPKVEEWINEYAIPNNVHPAVIGYIFSNYISSNRSEEIEDMPYSYEEPEVGEKNLDQNGCKGRTNDPRGWVSLSKTLFAFEEDLMNKKFIGKDVENLLQVSIESKLRKDWAEDFYSFYNIPTLSPKDVVEKNYTKEDLPDNIDSRFACMSALLLANEEEIYECRKFIRKYCDPEYLQLYDIYWIGEDQKRMEKIKECDLREMLNEDNIKSEEVKKAI